jgi:4-alpha-glucanotransferase
MATTGTHDTEPLVVWWRAASGDERAAVLALPLMSGRAGESASASEELSAGLRAAIVEAVYASRSELAILPVQDVFGWSDRINTPAVVDDVNWTWRLPWPVEELETRPEAVEVAAMLRDFANRHGR